MDTATKTRFQCKFKIASYLETQLYQAALMRNVDWYIFAV